jgi:hypothetical protein
MPHSNHLPPTDTCPRTTQGVLGRTPPPLKGVSCPNARLPFGLTLEQWRRAADAGWMGMRTDAVATWGRRAAWKTTAALED